MEKRSSLLRRWEERRRLTWRHGSAASGPEGKSLRAMCASRQSTHRSAPTMRCAPQYLLRHWKSVIRENTMRSTFTRIPATLAIACAIALGVFSANANAQVRDINEKALLLDTRGAPVMSGSLCWHTGYGPAPLWTAGCHAERPVPVAQYVAPVAALV